jgi:hypothetical protein
MARKKNKKPSQRAVAAIERDHKEIDVAKSEGYAELFHRSVLVDHVGHQITCEELGIFQLVPREWTQEQWVARILEVAGMVWAKKEISR